MEIMVVTVQKVHSTMETLVFKLQIVQVFLTVFKVD